MYVVLVVLLSYIYKPFKANVKFQRWTEPLFLINQKPAISFLFSSSGKPLGRKEEVKTCMPDKKKILND